MSVFEMKKQDLFFVDMQSNVKTAFCMFGMLKIVWRCIVNDFGAMYRVNLALEKVCTKENMKKENMKNFMSEECLNSF